MTKYFFEYHMSSGKFVGRECDSKEHMDALVDGFSGSRKGSHDFTVKNEESGQDVRVVVPLDQVRLVRAYGIEDEPTEEEA